MVVVEHAEKSDQSSSQTKPWRILLAVHDQALATSPFIHALCIACASKAELEIVDVRTGEFRLEPLGVRTYLEKWGLLPEGSKRGDVGSIGLRIKKVVKKKGGKRELQKYLRKSPKDLLVVGAAGEGGKGHLFSGSSIAEYLANDFEQNTLFIPANARPFVDPESGEIALSRILIPVKNERFLLPALTRLQMLLSLFPQLRPEVILLHAGDTFPPLPEIANVFDGKLRQELLQGEPVVEAICRASDIHRADLIVMATHGRDSLAQKVVGSTTEHVLRQAPCPVLSVSIAH